MSYNKWRPYVSVAQRREKSLKAMEKLRKKGKEIEPIEIPGNTIARSFWGKAWCKHLELFSDFDNRLPRGRTYARNGSVCHLAIKAGTIEAIVSGSELYHIKIDIKPLQPALWLKIKKKCSGKIGSMFELLQGELSDQVMAIVTDDQKGLLPLEGQIQLDCNCLDWAEMCKHIAAVLYGVGHRLDSQPELLFLLRCVDANELIDADLALPDAEDIEGKMIAADQLSDIFGIDLDLDIKQATKAKKTDRKKAPTRKTKAIKATQTQHKKAKPSSRSLTTKLPKIRPTGKTVARLRKKLKFSASDFADRLNVTPTTIYRWEKSDNRLNLQPKVLEALAILHQQTYKK